MLKLVDRLRAWRRGARHDRAVAAGLKAIEQAAEFERLYPGARHFVSRGAADAGGGVWISQAGVHGRYLVTMQLAVTVAGSGSGSQISASGSPRFTLREVIAVDRGAKEVSVRYGHAWAIGPEGWAGLIERGGDLETLGIDVTRDAPVPGFDRHWRDA